MAFDDYKIPSVKDLKELPKDVILPAVVIGVDIKTWREILSPESLDKFDEESRDQAQVIVTYECQGYRRDDKFSYYEQPSTGSKLGRYMVKYDKFPQVADEIKVQFDDEGRSTIVIKK